MLQIIHISRPRTSLDFRFWVHVPSKAFTENLRHFLGRGRSAVHRQVRTFARTLFVQTGGRLELLHICYGLRSRQNSSGFQRGSRETSGSVECQVISTIKYLRTLCVRTQSGMMSMFILHSSMAFLQKQSSING
jgi:hypothetical protein